MENISATIELENRDATLTITHDPARPKDS